MKQFKPSVKDAMVTIDHVEETSEGLLKGGFAIIGGDDDISPLANYVLCINTTNCDCNPTCPTPKKKSGDSTTIALKF